MSYVCYSKNCFHDNPQGASILLSTVDTHQISTAAIKHSILQLTLLAAVGKL